VPSKICNGRGCTIYPGPDEGGRLPGYNTGGRGPGRGRPAGPGIPIPKGAPKPKPPAPSSPGRAGAPGRGGPINPRMGPIPRTFAANDPSYYVPNIPAPKLKNPVQGLGYGFGGMLASALGSSIADQINEAQMASDALATAKSGLVEQVAQQGIPTGSLLPTIESAQRLAEPSYLPQGAPTFPVGLPTVDMPTFNQPLLGPGEAGAIGVETAGLPSVDSAPYNQSVLGSQPGQLTFPGQTPGINPTAGPTAGRSFGVNPDSLLGTLSDILSNPHQALQAGLNYAVQAVTPFLPRDLPLPRIGTPGLTGLNTGSVPFLNMAQSPQTQPQAQPEAAPATQPCACKKGDSPKKEKGKCAQGYYRQHEDGSTDYIEWSSRKCQSSPTPKASPPARRSQTSSQGARSSSPGRRRSSASVSQLPRRARSSPSRTVLTSLLRNFLPT